MEVQIPTVAELRQPTIYGIVMFDLFATIFAVFLIWLIFGFRSPRAFFVLLAITFVVGIMVHLYFGIDTMIGYYIGVNPRPWRPEPTQNWPGPGTE